MLEPGEGPDACYRYTLRVIGSPEELRRLLEDSPDVPVHRLAGQPLLLAPARHSSRDRVTSLFAKNGVTMGPIVDGRTPLELMVRALAGEGFAIMSDEYSAVGFPGNTFPFLCDEGRRYSQKMRLRGREELTGGVHSALRLIVREMSMEERKRGWNARPSALR
jgi:hypothetical protein